MLNNYIAVLRYWRGMTSSRAEKDVSLIRSDRAQFDWAERDRTCGVSAAKG